jgi:hypothetical protein
MMCDSTTPLAYSPRQTFFAVLPIEGQGVCFTLDTPELCNHLTHTDSLAF